MNTFKGTPGEWTINSVETAFCDIGVKSPLIKDGKVVPGFTFKRVARCDHLSDWGVESEANGKLIAASKQMMEALQECVLLYGSAGWSNLTEAEKSLLEKMEAALSAALD
jgi:hypothetical protein